MLHQQIHLTEKHPEYPTLWKSLCGTWRIIRCKDDIQFIVQQFKRPTWRSQSYHVEWESISLIYEWIQTSDSFSSTQAASESLGKTG